MNIIDKIGSYLQTGRFWYTRDISTITKFSVHHDAIPHDNRTAEQVLQTIFGIHNGKNGWPGISYHYYIHRDGTIYQLNKHEWVTWIDGINWDAIGIVLNGYFHSPYNNNITDAQKKSLKELLDQLSTQHPEFPASQGDVYAHRERAQTACPGDKVYPLVKEYREKLGDVNWGNIPPTPPPSNDVIPQYLKTMLQERNLSLANESQIRDFFSKADKYENIVVDLNVATTKLAQIKEIIK